MILEKLKDADIAQFKRDMQESFQMGALEGGYPMQDNEVILPESHIDRSLQKDHAIAYTAVQDGKIVGGAIVVLDQAKQEGHLDFLYVKHGCQGQGVGKFIWFTLENLHPEIKVWLTCTPYFEKRNIHFYINVCGFQAVEFFHKGHPDPQEAANKDGMDGQDGAAAADADFEMFSFKKVL